jgi:Xaa-Pro aminopeptidase
VAAFSYGPDERRKWRRLPFSDEEYGARLEAIRSLAERESLDVILIGGNGIDSSALRYLTGFPNHYKGEAVLAVAIGKEPVFLTNALAHGEPMHVEIYQTIVDDVRCAPSDRGRTQYSDAPSLWMLIGDLFQDWSIASRRIGTVGFSPTLGRVMAGADIEAKPLDEVFAAMRARKSPAELALMRRGGDISDIALKAGLKVAQPGNGEREIAGAIAGAMMGAGAEEALYIIQAVSGPRSGFRNVGASERILEPGDPIYIGFGHRFGGYCGRIGTGTAAGTAGPELLRLLEANALMTEAAVAAAVPGAPVVRAVDAALQVAKELGVHDNVIAGGHGVGVHTHDRPFIQPGSDDMFEEGMVFVLEPVIYVEGFATANAERLYEITASGATALSSIPLRVWEMSW